MIALAFAGMALAAFTHFETVAVSGVALKNNSIADLRTVGAVFDTALTTTTGSVNNSAYKASVYYADGPKWTTLTNQRVDTIDFTLAYNLMEGPNPGTPYDTTKDAVINFFGGNNNASNATFRLFQFRGGIS